jgi:arsenate reductase-like glutaredoxin family protein
MQITEEPPTADQLKTIFEYLGTGKVGEIVKGATGESEALRIFKGDPESFQRPVLVDWNNGKVVVGVDESKILKMLREKPSES